MVIFPLVRCSDETDLFLQPQACKDCVGQLKSIHIWLARPFWGVSNSATDYGLLWLMGYGAEMESNAHSIQHAFYTRNSTLSPLNRVVELCIFWKNLSENVMFWTAVSSSSMRSCHLLTPLCHSLSWSACVKETCRKVEIAVLTDISLSVPKFAKLWKSL